MPYDPNDPNQDSQRPDQVIDPTTGALTNQATAQMNDFGAYMRSHPGWTPTPAQLQEINAQLKDGRISPNDPSYLPLYLMAAAAGATIGGGALSSFLSGANSVASVPAAGSSTSAASGGIPAAFGQTAVDTVADTAIPGLSSTPIGSGMITAAPTSTASTAFPSASAGLPDWLKTAQDVGDALSKTSVGRAQGRLGEANANQQQARAAVDLYNSQLEAPSVIGRNAVRGDILSNARDATISGVSPNIPVPTISGGLRPSMFSDATRQAGTSISNNARDSAAALTVPKVPVLPDLPQASGLDQFLNTGSSVANILGAAKPVLSQIPWGSIF